MPGIPYGQAFYDGVKYIKVNRYDSGGLDRSSYLSQLQSITLTYPDRSAIEYPITTVQEQADFYLYSIPAGYGTSSKGDINDYRFTGTQNPYTYTHPLVSTLGIAIIGSGSTPFTDFIFANTTYDSTNLSFSNTDGGIIFQQTPNTQITAIISSSVDPNGGIKDFRFVYYYNGEENTIENFLSISSTTLLTSSIKINIDAVEGGKFQFAIRVINTSGGGDPIYSSTRLILSQPVSLFNGSSSLVIFDPDALNFDYNDYNPLLGNAETPQYSTVWMDVDYSQNPLVPVNFGLIISGTADRAFVQDSNYSSKAWSNLRYNGSRTNSYITT
jgi:hypothetical protein